MAATVLMIDSIISDPQIRGGRPIIAGTGIRVSDVAALTVFQQRTPDEIAINYNLSLAQVYAALAYYYAHKKDIDEEIRSDDAVIQQAKEQRLGS
jgi:uncharacterized protein (DUF433 family)